MLELSSDDCMHIIAFLSNVTSNLKSLNLVLMTKKFVNNDLSKILKAVELSYPFLSKFELNLDYSDFPKECMQNVFSLF